MERAAKLIEMCFLVAVPRPDTNAPTEKLEAALPESRRK